MTPLLPAQTLSGVDRIHHADALRLLRSLATGSIDLIVTSPPYDDLRKYNGYSFPFERIAHESYRVLKEGGVLVWVVGDATVNGSETLTSFRQALYFTDAVGFRMHDTMIWHKDGSPSPQSNRYLQTHELMFILSKGTPKSANLIRQKVKSFAGKSASFRSDGAKLSGFNYGNADGLRVADNVWYVPVGWMKTTADVTAYAHPAMFPEELAERHIKTWSNEGDTVLDYFMGSGTTAKMARNNKRRFIGCDISLDYVLIARDRLRLPFEKRHTPVNDDVSDLPMFAASA